MKHVYKYIVIEDRRDDPDNPGHRIYAITNKRAGDIIGALTWYAPWKRHVAMFNPDSVWSHDCLSDVFLSLGIVNAKGNSNG